ncbi:hypothetical protein HCA58_16000 [Micromonospora sp. HNM0581]|nr:hypothetical protein [Micromonospora sp. HNM0581]NLU79860.1 hypothetical protein [Micromonospora sp. HNM0581]
MGIDYSHPNIEALDALGILSEYDQEHGQEVGWARSVIQQYWRVDFTLVSGTGGQLPVMVPVWDEEERALIDWFEAEVVDQWDTVVPNILDDQVGIDGYNEDDPKYELDTTVEHPEDSEYSGGDNPNHELSVSTEALRHMANQIDRVVGLTDGTNILLTVRNQLAELNMLPGGFAKAEVLRQRIEGVSADDAGLRGDVMGMLLATHGALVAVKEGLLQIADGYDDAEEFNDMTASSLREQMGSAWVKIEGLSEYGASSSTNTGGDQ